MAIIALKHLSPQFKCLPDVKNPDSQRRLYSRICQNVKRRYNMRSVGPHRLVGLGRRPLTPITGVRVPLGTPPSFCITHAKIINTKFL